jgi:urease accessory protein
VPASALDARGTPPGAPEKARADSGPLQRADGALSVEAVCRDGCTALHIQRQRAPLRALTPASDREEPRSVILLNAAGGVAGGDRLALSVTARAESAVRVCGQAAEKVYRALDEPASLDVRLEAHDGAWLEYLPQGTILFDGARLRRRTLLDAAPHGTVLAGELLTFGRIARGERFTRGLIHDEWLLRRDGRLVWADSLRVDGGEALRSLAGFDGASVLGSVLLASRGAEALLSDARELLGGVAHGVRFAATAFPDLLLIRLLADAGMAAREAFAAVWRWLRSRGGGWEPALPAIWSC